jgi:hypothetical protein
MIQGIFDYSLVGYQRSFHHHLQFLQLAEYHKSKQRGRLSGSSKLSRFHVLDTQLVDRPPRKFKENENSQVRVLTIRIDYKFGYDGRQQHLYKICYHYLNIR